jgi:solute:Na+ symporter, SSS family
VILISFISLLFALSGESIFHLVGDSSALSLVSLFVPLVAGLYFKGSNQYSAVVSMASGFFVWAVLNYRFEYEFSLLAGLLASILAYLLTSVLSSILGKAQGVGKHKVD